MIPGESNFSPSGEGETKRGWSISYDSLSAEVRPYADNLEAQIWAVFAKYGIVVGEGLAPSHTGGDKPRPHILDELKAANPTTEDLEHLADLLDQLDHIRKTGEPMERTKREYHISSPEFTYNETEAKRLGLEKVEVKGYPEVDVLIQKVIDGAIDTETPKGKKKFLKTWQATCPDLPMPRLPHQNNFWYIAALKNKRIISNLDGDPEPITPNFTDDEILLIDSWESTYYDAPDAKTKHTSSLINELLGQESVVDIKCQDLEIALWQNDPALRIPTEEHQDILSNLDLSSDDFELRLIRQDEYARLAETQLWGTHDLLTSFDHYFLGDDGARRSLFGGSRGDGGSSAVDSFWRDSVHGSLAVRLVIARKQHI